MASKNPQIGSDHVPASKYPEVIVEMFGNNSQTVLFC